MKARWALSPVVCFVLNPTFYELSQLQTPRSSIPSCPAPSLLSIKQTSPPSYSLQLSLPRQSLPLQPEKKNATRIPMAIPEPPSATRKVDDDTLDDWLDSRDALEAAIIRLYKKNREHLAALENIKQDKELDEGARKRLLAEIRSKIRRIDGKMLDYKEQLERLNSGLKAMGICVVPIHRVLDRFD
ncbi:unnamed protein product [Tuber aestivum]|uniref:Uncharacterized protein n=1 Tax=Tuber aestivum TaxID=59557 RepID=A0A292Q343_9PEZI|nr:unnamed protein product [Tuber aestivum]